MTIASARAAHTVTLSGEVFGETLTGMKYIQALCPDIDPPLAGDLIQAVDDFGWGVVQDYDERTLFQQQYMQIKQAAFRERGMTAFELYDRYEPIVEAMVMKVTNWGDITGDFMGIIARDGTLQWLIRQIGIDTFWTDAVPRVQCVLATAMFEPLNVIGTAQLVVPRRAGAEPEAVMVNDEQMAAIMYYRSDLNPRALENIQEWVNDNWTLRSPMDVYGQLQRTNQGIVTRPGCLVLDDNSDYRLYGMPLATIGCDIMPQGVDLITRTHVTDMV